MSAYWIKSSFVSGPDLPNFLDQFRFRFNCPTARVEFFFLYTTTHFRFDLDLGKEQANLFLCWSLSMDWRIIVLEKNTHFGNIAYKITQECPDICNSIYILFYRRHSPHTHPTNTPKYDDPVLTLFTLFLNEVRSLFLYFRTLSSRPIIILVSFGKNTAVFYWPLSLSPTPS